MSEPAAAPPRTAGATYLSAPGPRTIRIRVAPYGAQLVQFLPCRAEQADPMAPLPLAAHGEPPAPSAVPAAAAASAAARLQALSAEERGAREAQAKEDERLRSWIQVPSKAACSAWHGACHGSGCRAESCVGTCPSGSCPGPPRRAAAPGGPAAGWRRHGRPRGPHARRAGEAGELGGAV